MRHVFVDESSQNGHKFMVLGALILPGHAAAGASARFGDLLSAHAITAELKWTKVSRAKLSVYRAAVDLYFDELYHAGAEFHSLVLDCQLLDHRTYNQGDPDLGFNKFLYQLLYHRVGKRHGRYEKIVVDLDARNSSRDNAELQDVLNTTLARDYGDRAHRPFVRLAHRDSKAERLIQLADLLSGAIAWHKNDHDARPDSSEAKAALANHVAQRAGYRRLGHDTHMQNARFAMWNFRLSARGR